MRTRTRLRLARHRPTWLSGRVVLLVDALFGLALVVIALAGGAPLPTPRTAPAASTPGPVNAVDVTARLGGASPPGQATGFALAGDGSLTVVDRGRNVVIRLDPNGQPIAEWGPQFGPGLEAVELAGIAPDGDGWYLLDRGGQRILRLDANGLARPDRTIDLEPLATYGPNSLASDSQGNLYMADTGRDRIVVFDSFGHMTGALGDAGRDLGKFKQPMALALGPDGSLFVSDWENARVERWDADGHAVAAWPVPVHAWGIAVDRYGRVFVPDGEHKAVRMFDANGVLLAQFGGGAGPPLPVEFPGQVVVSSDATRLWVLGSDGLARIDLTPYAGVRPDGLTQFARTPLLVLGGILLLLAAVGAVRLLRPLRATSLGRRGTLGHTLIAVGAPAAICAGLLVADPQARVDPWPRMFLLALASLIFAIGCAMSALARPWQWLSAFPGCREPPLQTNPRAGVAGIVLTLTLAAVAANTWWFGRFQTPEATRGALVWLAAICIAISTLAYYARGPVVPRPTLWTLVPWLLFALALIPRAWHNADLPYGVWFDEAEGGLQARKFLTSGLYTPITDTYGRDASLQYYLIADAQAFIRDPVLAARLVSALLGALCAPLIYLLGRELFGWRVGLAAGVLLATSRWHLDVSRLGWDPISLPLCAILAFWLLARALRTQRWTDMAWAGLAIGLGLHAYIGYRVLPVVAFGLLAYGAWLRRFSLAGALARFGLAVGGAALAALPVMIFALRDPSGFNGRLNQTLILNEPVSQSQKLEELWSNLQKHALMFHVAGDMNGRHNIPGVPMLDPLSGLLLMLGLAVLLTRLFDWRSLLLLGWAGVSMAGGVFTFPFEAPQAMRTLGVTPVLVLVIALAVVLLADRAVVIFGWRRCAVRSLVGAAATLPIIWIGFSNVDTFFGRQMNDPTVWESFSTRETLPSRAALAAQTRYEAILGSPTIAPSMQQQLMVPEVQTSMRGFDPVTDLPYRGNGPSLIILESEHDAGLADEVARFYPDAPRTPIVPPNGTRPTAEQLLLDANVLAAHRGLAAVYRGSDGATIARRESSPLLSPEQVPVPLPADVVWRSDLALEAPGGYQLRASPGFRMTLDGADIVETDRLQLARGNHLLVVAGRLVPGARLELSWQSPAQPDLWLLVDSNALFIAPEGGNGLEASFFPSLDFEGYPTETAIDPMLDHYYHLNPFARLNLFPPVWSAEWRGFVDVPTAGAYRFQAERLSRAGLWIDEQRVFDDTADAPDDTDSGVIQLTPGRHAIRLRMQQRGDGGPRLYLYWTPPGGGREILPGRLLYPPAARFLQ